MNFFNKTFNYITSFFFNNTKLKHHTLGSLKIFFERNNKFLDSVSTLGNVFRNSKWSDLKIQNIKNTFINSRANKYLVILTITLTMVFIVGFSYKYGILAKIPLAESICDQISLWRMQMSDKLTALMGSLYLIFKGIGLRFKQRLENIKLQLFGVDTESENEKWRDLIRRLDAMRPQETPSYIDELMRSGDWRSRKNSDEEIDLMSRVSWQRWMRSNFYLKQSQNYIEQITNFPHHLMLLQGMRNGLTVLPNERLYFQLLHTLTLNKREAFKFFKPETQTSLEGKYTLDKLVSTPLIYLPTEWFDTWGSLDFSKVIITNPNDLIRFGLKNIHLDPINLNVESYLELAKQDRWLIKNFLSSDTLDISNNGFTQSQKLISTNLLLSNTFGSNVWLSSRFNNLELIKSAEASASVLNILYPSLEDMPKSFLTVGMQNHNTLNNFNFIEASRVWTSKRYFLTNGFDTTNYETSPLTTERKTQLNQNNETLSVLDLFVATQALSLPENLCDLNLTFMDQTGPKEVFIPVGDMQNDYSESDLALNEDLLFINAITSNVTTDKRVYFNSWYTDLNVDPTQTK